LAECVSEFAFVTMTPVNDSTSTLGGDKG